MADILYKIVYEEDDFRTEQHIVEVGTNQDRVAFVTTEESEEYVPEGKKVALQRHGRDPFKKKEAENDKNMPDVYIVPIGEKNAQYFDVITSGGKWAFHLNCGYADEKGKHFTHREEGHAVLVLNARPRPKLRGAATTDNKPSLPWPG